MEPDKITLAKWVHQVLEQSFTWKNIKFEFKATNIWPFNSKAMDNNIQPSQIYTATSVNDQGNEDLITKDEVEHNQYYCEPDA
jgi:hypothetical protein